MTGSRRELTTFLGLTFALSAVCWWIIISAGTLGAYQGRIVFILMWCPGVSALVTRLLFQKNLRGEGWRWGATRYEIIAYLLPIAYAIIAYGSVWLAGLGRLDLSRVRPNGSVFAAVATFVVLGSVQSLLSALGEELGWRGFLAPKLAESMSFTSTALVSGSIWAAWHVPLIAFADYNSGTPTWYAILCFGVGVISMAFPLAWLRLRSGSVWPAAILHASHNLYVQAFFDRVTVDTGPTRYLVGEFGAVLALSIAATAWVFWRMRPQLADASGAAGVGDASIAMNSV